MYRFRSLAKIFSVLLLAGIPSLVFAEKYVITAGEYSGALEADSGGVLWDIHHLIAKEAGLDIEFQVLPIRRARHAFYAGEADGMYAIFADVLRPVPVVYSAPFARLKRYILTAPNTPPLSRLDQLANKQVGIVLGYVYNRLDEDMLYNQSTQIRTASSQLNNLRMLVSGRLDAIIANVYEIEMLSIHDDLPMPSFDGESPITEYDFAYAYHDNEKGRQLNQRMSAAIRRLKSDGRLKLLSQQFEETFNQSSRLNPVPTPTSPKTPGIKKPAQ